MSSTIDRAFQIQNIFNLRPALVYRSYSIYIVRCRVASASYRDATSSSYINAKLDKRPT